MPEFSFWALLRWKKGTVVAWSFPEESQTKREGCNRTSGAVQKQSLRIAYARLQTPSRVKRRKKTWLALAVRPLSSSQLISTVSIARADHGEPSGRPFRTNQRVPSKAQTSWGAQKWWVPLLAHLSSLSQVLHFSMAYHAHHLLLMRLLYCSDLSRCRFLRLRRGPNRIEPTGAQTSAAISPAFLHLYGFNFSIAFDSSNRATQTS